jgi:tripartite-type tricarboxylate transporter receptor subunit TctC
MQGVLPQKLAEEKNMLYAITIRYPNLLRAALFAMLASLALPAAAQDYPSKVVRIVVPFPAGGSTDVLTRMLAQRLTEALGQNFIVDNRPGATGTIAGALVAKSPPDGHTLIMHSSSSYLAGFLYRKLSYDGVSAFEPIIRSAISSLYLVSAASLPVKGAKELVALARKRPDEVNYATVGRGSAAHLAVEMFNFAAGIKTVPVHYKGAAPSMIALASGEVGFMILNLLDPQPFIKQGKLRGLATTGAARSPALPDVPTLRELGIDVEANLWFGFFATGRTPASTINVLNAETARFLSDTKTSQWLVNSLGGQFSPHTPAQFAAFLASDVATWQKVIKRSEIQLD